MSALTLWVVIAVCSTLNGEKDTSRFIFDTQAGAVEFSQGRTDSGCASSVYEANLQLLEPQGE